MSAFAGVRVVDLSRSLAGAFACMHLADFGADVVRLAASSMPERPGTDRDVALLCAHRNTRAATTDTWLADARRLAARADVVVTDGPVGELERFRLDATTLMQANGGLIHIHLPAFGRTGAGSALPDDALLLSAASGAADFHFATTDRPVAPVVPFLLYEQGALGATAVAAALVGRQRSGLGRQLTVSGLHSVAIMNLAVIVDAPGVMRFDGFKAPLQGAPNYRPYRCADGRWIFLGTLTPPFFFRALELFDAMDVMVLPGVDGDFLRLRTPEVQPVAIDRLQKVFATRSLEEWRVALDEISIPNAPILTREEWMASDLVADNTGLVTVDHPVLGPVSLPNVTVELTRTPGAVRHLGTTVAAAAVWSDVPPAPASSGSPLGFAEGPPGLGEGPLAGVRVIDLGTFLAGPVAPAILRDYGAEVIKVETPAGDAYRIFTASYAAVNQGKDNVALDLKDEAARRQLHRLVGDADILLDNVRPGVQEHLGTDATTLHTVNPDLIRCSISAWGRSPSTAPAFDPLIQSMSGLMVAQGGSENPVLQVMPVHDIGCATMAAFGSLAALYARPQVGGGQEVRMSLAASAMVIQAGELTTYAGRPAPVQGGVNYPGLDELHRVYECSDGWVAVSWPAGGFLPSLEDVVAAVRVAAGDSAPAGPRDLAGAVAACPVEVALDTLVELGVPAVRVLGRKEVYNDPWLVANDFYRTVDDAIIGPVLAMRGYADWGGWVDAAPRRSAATGEHDAKWLRGDAAR